MAFFVLLHYIWDTSGKRLKPLFKILSYIHKKNFFCEEGEREWNFREKNIDIIFEYSFSSGIFLETRSNVVFSLSSFGVHVTLELIFFWNRSDSERQLKTPLSLPPLFLLRFLLYIFFASFICWFFTCIFLDNLPCS